MRDKRRTLPATPKGPGRQPAAEQKLRSAYWGAACLMLLIALLPDIIHLALGAGWRWRHVWPGDGLDAAAVVSRVDPRPAPYGLMRISEGNFTQPVRVPSKPPGSLGEALVSVESTRISLRALMADAGRGGRHANPRAKPAPTHGRQAARSLNRRRACSRWRKP